MLDNVLHVRS